MGLELVVGVLVDPTAAHAKRLQQERRHCRTPRADEFRHRATGLVDVIDLTQHAGELLAVVARCTNRIGEDHLLSDVEGLRVGDQVEIDRLVIRRVLLERLQQAPAIGPSGSPTIASCARLPQWRAT